MKDSLSLHKLSLHHHYTYVMLCTKTDFSNWMSVWFFWYQRRSLSHYTQHVLKRREFCQECPKQSSKVWALQQGNKLSEQFFANVIALTSGVRRKFSWGVFHSVAYGVICIWCALFVSSYSCFPDQRFGEVCADQP